MKSFLKVVSVLAVVPVIVGCKPRSSTPLHGERVAPISEPVKSTGDFQVAPDQLVTKEPEKQVDPYPHSVGSVWNLRETAGDQNNLVELRVDKGAKPEEFSIQTTRNSESVLKEVYELKDGTLLRSAAGFPDPGKIEPPMPVLKLPLKSKDTWNWAGKIVYPDGSFKGKATFTVYDLEPVTVPAGSFKAYKVVQDFTLDVGGKSQAASSIQWFAPGVGIVKTESGAGQQLTQAVLTGYKLAKP